MLRKLFPEVKEGGLIPAKRISYIYDKMPIINRLGWYRCYLRIFFGNAFYLGFGWNERKDVR